MIITPCPVQEDSEDAFEHDRDLPVSPDSNVKLERIYGTNVAVRL